MAQLKIKQYRVPGLKLLSPDKSIIISNLIPTATRLSQGEIARGEYSPEDESWRFSYHMDQMAIREGARVGKLDPSYNDVSHVLKRKVVQDGR